MSKPLIGCGDHGCVIAPPEGMGTNGGCRCRDWKLKLYIQRLEREIVSLQAKILAEIGESSD